MEAPAFTEQDLELLRKYIDGEVEMLAGRLEELRESVEYDMNTTNKRVAVGKHVPIGVMTAKLAVDYNIAVARLAIWQRVRELLNDPSELHPRPPAPEPKKSNRRTK